MKQKQTKNVLSIPRWISQKNSEPVKKRILKKASGGEDIPESSPAAEIKTGCGEIKNYERALNRKIAAELMPCLDGLWCEKNNSTDFSTVELYRLKNILENNRAADTDPVIVSTAENLLAILAG